MVLFFSCKVISLLAATIDIPITNIAYNTHVIGNRIVEFVFLHIMILFQFLKTLSKFNNFNISRYVFVLIIYLIFIFNFWKYSYKWKQNWNSFNVTIITFN